jgi:glutamate 5-kinase
MKLDLQNKKRLVIKIGSSLLVEKGELREKWLNNFTKDVAALIKNNQQIIIVTSGAIALGRSDLKTKNSKLSLEEKQAAAAIGQIQLMSFYRDSFKKLDINVAQILLTASDCNSRERYLNCQNTIETLLKNKVIPIINENDSIAVDEIKVGDNDRLAARVAQMSSSDLMILFSDIDGLYDANPKTNKDAKLIKEVFAINDEIEKMAGTAVSDVGTGGMITKIMAVKMLENSGCDSVITSGIEVGSLKKLILEKQNFTIFYSRKNSKNQRRKWLSGFLNLKSGVIVNKCAVEALKNKKISLLPIGIIDVVGDFKKGDAIFIRDEKSRQIASGISNYSSFDVAKVLEKKSSEVKEILGNNTKDEVVHIDNLVVL